MMIVMRRTPWGEHEPSARHSSFAHSVFRSSMCFFKASTRSLAAFRVGSKPATEAIADSA